MYQSAEVFPSYSETKVFLGKSVETFQMISKCIIYSPEELFFSSTEHPSLNTSEYSLKSLF